MKDRERFLFVFKHKKMAKPIEGLSGIYSHYSFLFSSQKSKI
jgi:hypothetical protein